MQVGMSAATPHEKYKRLVEKAKTLEPMSVVVAHPCDESSLTGALDAAQLGLIKPTLVGPKAKIEMIATRLRLDISACVLVDAPHSHAAAAKAVELARAGKVDALMKGSLHTDELLVEVVNRESGLRTARRISHCFVMDVPGHPDALIISDAAVNIAPTLEDKVDIVQNAIDLEAAAVKQIVSPVAGRANVLIAPDIEAGNMLAKSLAFLANADSAGIVLGAKVPIILTSRADSVMARLASCAVAVFVAQAQRR